jgi:adiponectin receptor
LNQLSTLKEDISSYLPNLPLPLSLKSHQPLTIPSAREWISSLPSRLSVLEVGLESNLRGGGGFEESKKRVLEVVKGLLPSEDWAGWERLGWEDEVEDEGMNHGLEMKGKMRRVGENGFARGEGEGRDGQGEEEGEERLEWLFPNRTPASASANAIATKRRTTRSFSLGSTSYPRHVNTSPRKPIPTLSRTLTAPLPTKPLPGTRTYNNSYDNDGYGAQDEDEYDEKEPGREEGEEGEEDVRDILDSPDIMDTKLTKAVAGGSAGGDGLGPSVGDALEKSGRGVKLIEYEDLPFVWRNNEHILTG